MEKMTKINEILSQSSGDDWRQNLKELFRCFKIFKSDTLLCGSYFSWSHCLFHELFFFFEKPQVGQRHVKGCMLHADLKSKATNVYSTHSPSTFQP